MPLTHTVDEVELAQRIAKSTIEDPKSNIYEVLKILKDEQVGGNVCRKMVDDFSMQLAIHGESANLNAEILRKKLIELLEK